MSEPDHAMPAFPQPCTRDGYAANSPYGMAGGGLSMRDYFATHVQADDRLVKCIRAMDDVALELFAVAPDVEREEWITETGPLEGKTKWHAMTEVEKVTARLQLEAKAIAKVRFMQADAMLEAREAKP